MARRVHVQSGFQATSKASSQFRSAVSLRSILTMAGLILLVAAGALNRNDAFLPLASEVQPPVSPDAGLQENRPGDSFEGVAPATPSQWADLATPFEGTTTDSSMDYRKQSPTLWVQHGGNAITPRPQRKTPAIPGTGFARTSTPLTGLALRGVWRKQPPVQLIAERRFPEVIPPSPDFSEPSSSIGLRWKRLALIQTGSLGLAFMGIRKFDQYFGSAQRPFRIGNDWDKDHTLHFDELIHFQGSYRVAQGLIGLYRWSGVGETWSECLGAGTAASVMTLLEYIDGRRPKPKQGASFSDFTANLLGVGFALAKIHVGALEDIDFHLNYTSFGDVLHKRTLLQYDRMTHWLTYSMKRRLQIPLHVGVGYGVQNAFKHNVRPEYYLGIGLTPLDILERYSPTTAKPLAWLGIYHVGLQMQLK